MFILKEDSRGTLTPACQDPNFLIHSCRKGCLWWKQKWTPSLLYSYRLTFTMHTLGKCCWSCFTGRIYSFCVNTQPPKILLKKRATCWLQPDNWLCSVTPFIVTSISSQYKTRWTKAFVQPVEFQSKGCSHTLLEAPPLSHSITMTALPPSSHPTECACQLTYRACMCHCLGISNLRHLC